MSEPVLLVYATRYGSTKEVAEVVAATLREQGFEVDLQPMRKAQTLEGYCAVVLGAPLYIGRLHKDARRFLMQHRGVLSKRPVAIFALGPIRNDEQEWQEACAQLKREIAKFSWLTPVALEMFGGKYDPTTLHFPDSLLASLPASPLHNQPASDARDWTAIRTWASNLIVALQPTLASRNKGEQNHL
ncbi:MAG: flavodoxin domain-containing protein [Candidatus Caldatribacterium sp.]|nr:flavodoxin domain-containing protein [Candidatus Caldatribacterium sp.]